MALALLSPVTTAQAQAPEPPSVVTPLKVEPDPNGVNLVNGKITMDLPVLSVPAAPRLSFQRVQDLAPYVSGTYTGVEVAYSSFSVHTGGISSDAFKCVDYDCVTIKGNGSTLEALGQVYMQGGSAAVYNFNLVHLARQGTQNSVQFYASSVTYPDGEVITYTYQTATQSGDPFDRTWYRPTLVSSNVGYAISITYHSSTYPSAGWGSPYVVKLYKTSDPGTTLAQHTYNSSGTTITDIGGRVYQCGGCGQGLGTQEEVTVGSLRLPGESSDAMQVAISTAGNLVGMVTRDGIPWTYTYTGLTNDPTFGYRYTNVTVAGPDGYNVVYNLGLIAGRNSLTASTNSIGKQTLYTFDGQYRPTLITFPESNKIQVVYDPLGNLTEKRTKAKTGTPTLPDLVETAHYNTSGCVGVMCFRPDWSKDALLRQTDYNSYNSAGQLTEQVDPVDASGVRRKTFIDYTTSGISRKSVVRVCGDTTTCGTTSDIRTEYYYWGNTSLLSNILQIDTPNGITLQTNYDYDNAGRMLMEDGPLAGVNDAKYFRYDVYGRKTWEIGPVGAAGLRLAKRYTYRDSDDKVVKVENGTLPNATSTTLTVTSQVDTAYDTRRNPIRDELSSGGVDYSIADKSYNNRNQLICSTVRMNLASPPTNACTQNAQQTDRIAKNVYDAAGQLLQLRKAVGSPLEQAYSTYSYTDNGKQQFVIDANGNRAKLEYDRYDRQQKWIFPSTTRPSAYNSATQATALATAGSLNVADYEEYAYDAVGNRTSQRKRDGASLTFAYDGMNRQIQKRVPNPVGGPNATATANCYTLASDSNDVCYSYDVRGLQLTAKFGWGSGEGLTSAYDLIGRLTSSMTNMGGMARTLSYEYDAGSRRTKLIFPDSEFFTYSYDASDSMTDIFRSGTTRIAAIGYDNLERRSSLTVGISTAYGYDAVSRLASLSHDLVGSGQDVTYGFNAYNPASQLLSKSRDNNAYAWTGYTDLTRNYTTNGLNQYTAVDGGSVSHDANGNLTSEGGTTYAYDRENRLLRATGASTVTMTYDPMGRLFQTSGGTLGTAQFLYDGDALVSEYGSSVTLLRRYVHGPGVDEPLFWYEGSSISTATRRILRADNQGSIVAISNNTGTSIGINSYDEWGVPAATNMGRFAYTGQLVIPELGMYYYKARIYSPKLGRFLQTDPIGYKDEINLYAYVTNDPINEEDPSGMCPICLPAVPAAIDAIVATVNLAGVVFAASLGSDDDDDDDDDGDDDANASGSNQQSNGNGPQNPRTQGATGSRANEREKNGGGRNAQKSNPDRVSSAKTRIESLKAQKQELSQKPNKTPADKAQANKIDNKIKHEQARMKDSENHSMKKKK